jgi:hypothetical protein
MLAIALASLRLPERRNGGEGPQPHAQGHAPLTDTPSRRPELLQRLGLAALLPAAPP